MVITIPTPRIFRQLGKIGDCTTYSSTSHRFRLFSPPRTTFSRASHFYPAADGIVSMPLFIKLHRSELKFQAPCTIHYFGFPMYSSSRTRKTETKLLTNLLLKAQAASKKKEGRTIAQERGLAAAGVSEETVHSIAKKSLQPPCSITPYLPKQAASQLTTQPCRVCATLLSRQATLHWMLTLEFWQYSANQGMTRS